MRVGVRFHAELVRFAPGGQARGFADLPDGASVADLLAQLDGLAQRRLVVGVNGELARPDTELHEGDTVDLLTPMSGGA